MNIQRQDLVLLETKLKHIFEKTPFFVEGKPMVLEAETGLSVFPEEGQNLSELIGLSWSRASQNFNTIYDQKLAK